MDQHSYHEKQFFHRETSIALSCGRGLAKAVRRYWLLIRAFDLRDAHVPSIGSSLVDKRCPERHGTLSPSTAGTKASWPCWYACTGRGSPIGMAIRSRLVRLTHAVRPEPKLKNTGGVSQMIHLFSFGHTVVKWCWHEPSRRLTAIADLSTKTCTPACFDAVLGLACSPRPRK